MCPAIAAPPGLTFDVPGGQFTRAAVKACWSGHCTERSLDLHPSTVSVNTTCTANACGAEAAPTGGRSGFAEIPGLPAAPVDVTVTFDDGPPRHLTVHPGPIPTGRPCGDPGPQALITVAPDGTLR